MSETHFLWCLDSCNHILTDYTLFFAKEKFFSEHP